VQIDNMTVAVITGAASGMGRSTALSLARRGASVAIADLNEERIAQTVAEIEALGARAIGVRCDVSVPADLERLRDQAVAAFGGVDILMNNAGVLPIGSIEAAPLAEFERAMRINFLAVVSGVQIFLPLLEARGGGHIVNTASLAGFIAYEPDMLAYHASKAAVVSLSESLFVALAPKGIGVTCLIPGPVATNIMEQTSISGELRTGVASYASAHFAMRTADEVGEMVAGAIADGRFFLPTNDNVTEALVRRASDPDAYYRELTAELAR